MDLSISRSSELPIGVQLAQRLRSHIRSGGLEAGARLPSVRDAAAAAGVNVNTVRAVYGRLEREGLLRSVHGRGTFVDRPATAADEAAERRELRGQIAALELELARRPPRATGSQELAALQPPGTLLSAGELRRIRDELSSRLREIDAERGAVLRRLRELPEAEYAPSAKPERGSPSLAGARVRWVYA